MQKSPLLLYYKVLLFAYADWYTHLLTSPEKQLAIFQECHQTYSELIKYSTRIYNNSTNLKCIQVGCVDHRFENKIWHKQYPFNLYSQIFLSYEHILNYMSSNIPGVTPHHQHLVNFTLRQLMDMFSPTNFPWTNPIVLKTSSNQAGMNFVQGYLNYLEDIVHYLNHQPPVGTENFKVGDTLAISPGQVIYRNKLIELIQYTPTTKMVYPEPLLIVPAWIMKYYILDLSPHNSMVKYLVDQGHTVFMISWKNPNADDANLSLEDYVNLGVIDALKVINDILPQQKVHCTGYCIGGTLLMMTAALMATKCNNQIKTITLFAAQVDFTDAGELRLFIDEEQLEALEETMQTQGYLSGEQMTSCFSMLRAKDLIWSRYIQDYLLGTRYPLNDMMAWDNDTTRLPYKMHSEYLRKMYLNNELAQGKFKIRGEKLVLSKIVAPLFIVSTVKDHVAPWKSVYKIHNLTNANITYILASGGHNSGIVSEPGHDSYNYQMLEYQQHKLSPEEWQSKASFYSGSWWLAWENWLSGFSTTMVSPSIISKHYKPLCKAPGTYVLQR